MTKWLSVFLQSAVSAIRSRRDLAFENLLLRQQLAVMKQTQSRPSISQADRQFWAFASRLWPNWRDALLIVKPDTVIRWHGNSFRRYWTRKSRPKGRPQVDVEIRTLIRRMSFANPLWGAPRIHGEIMKLGLLVSEATVSKYMKGLSVWTFSTLQRGRLDCVQDALWWTTSRIFASGRMIRRQLRWLTSIISGIWLSR